MKNVWLNIACVSLMTAVVWGGDRKTPEQECDYYKKNAAKGYGGASPEQKKRAEQDYQDCLKAHTKGGQHHNKDTGKKQNADGEDVLKTEKEKQCGHHKANSPQRKGCEKSVEDHHKRQKKQHGQPVKKTDASDSVKYPGGVQQANYEGNQGFGGTGGSAYGSTGSSSQWAGYGAGSGNQGVGSYGGSQSIDIQNTTISGQPGQQTGQVVETSEEPSNTFDGSKHGNMKD